MLVIALGAGANLAVFAVTPIRPLAEEARLEPWELLRAE